tara:strand:+ start:237586 stop:239109 length:1524 start_codon:yes stop_codon:yes gene_type:complete
MSLLPSDDSFEELRHRLTSGKYDRAREQVFDHIYSHRSASLLQTYLNKGLHVPQVLSCISDVVFDEDCSTAMVDLHTRIVSLGIEFVLEHVRGWEDLYFILFHERGHVLIDRLYRSRMDSFQSFAFANGWEDLYINNMILLFFDSSFCREFYAEADDEDFRLLLQQRFSTWCYTIRSSTKMSPELISRFNSIHNKLPKGKTNFFSLKCSYPAWMELGLQVEKLYGGKNASMSTIDSHGGLLPSGSSTEQEEEEAPLQADIDRQAKMRAVEAGVSTRGMKGTPIPKPPKVDPIVLTALQSFPKEALPAGMQSLISPNQVLEQTDAFIRSELVPVVQDAVLAEEGEFGKTGMLTSLSRSEALLLSSGIIPLYWDTHVEGKVVKYRLYVDVSGSMQDYWGLVPLIYSSLHSHVNEYYQFSGRVVPSSPTDTILVHNMGTNYEAVASHMLRDGVTHAIVVTDNTDSISSSQREDLSRQLSSLILLETNPVGKRGGFNAIAHTRLLLPSLGD